MLLSAFIFGLLGSFHCVGMCGPIAFLLPVDRNNAVIRFLQISSYHLGRLFTYGFLGMLFGLLGERMQLFGLQQYLSIAIGVLMIAVIFIPSKTFNRYNLSKPAYRLVGKLKSAMGARLKRKEPGTFFTLGFLNGLLPCGLVYMAIFAAIASGGVWEGSLYMVLFGLGTLPLMTTAIYLGNFLKGKARKYLLKTIPAIVVIIGILFILRGMGLAIPYVSPPDTVAVQQVSAQHSCH